MKAKQWEIDEDNDWILLDETDFENYHSEEESEINKQDNNSQEVDTRQASRVKASKKPLHCSTDRYSFGLFGQTKKPKPTASQLIFMALESSDIELIRASWIPARKDPTGSGVLLFKSLFTKFPDYLKFFSQFADLDIETLQENKKLIKHAVKVIDTVTFVVDSIGDEGKAEQLDEALINLVRGHMKRRIGLKEFRNLGIVIIDFICDLQQRRGISNRARTNSPGDYASLESKDSSEADYQETTDSCTRCQSYNHTHNINPGEQQINQSTSPQNMFAANTCLSSSPTQSLPSILDTNLLVTAWTKLYGSILDLVRRESGELDE